RKSDETDLPMVRILPHTRNQNTSPSGTIRFTLITGRSRLHLLGRHRRVSIRRDSFFGGGPIWSERHFDEHGRDGGLEPDRAPPFQITKAVFSRIRD
ncbi:hypothetical protein VQ042_24410, partial [Aurantimonas sp. A2-1-M11]|uniref:hypothetical protein n=1 Tax=Aurantimonas sp. A2-1-M11 TaxID=3113712 RepID=UPI002F92FFA6